MVYNFTGFKTACDETFDWMKKEYLGLRTGRASAAILDTISVESYGSLVPVNQVASINIEDPRTIRVSPWDKGVIKNIDTAIREANLGLSVAVDGEGLRVSFPELTSERRAGLIKISKEKLEEARIRIRTERQKILSDIDKGDLPDDEKTRSRNDLQKHVDEINKKLEEFALKKEKEISE